MRKALTLFSVLIFSSILVLGQIKTITGRVTDQQGQPAPFSTIRLKGSKKGVSADAEGNYSIKANPGDVLIVSGAGLESKEFKVTDASTLDISIVRANSNLTEV